MALTELVPAPRDGTSRQARRRPALDPASAPIDERGLAEHLAFAKALAARLVDVDDLDRPRGSWEAFLAGIGTTGQSAITSAELIAWFADPAQLSPAKAARLQRPHLTLFLVFLRLLEHARQGLAGLTARHLDYHFRTVLGLQPAAAVADEVFVLFTPQPKTAALELTRGLRLAAGRDSAGRTRAYALTAPLSATHARIRELRSVFVHKEVLELPDARATFTGSPAQKVLLLLALALGEPRPGDDLPAEAPGLAPRDPTTQLALDEAYADNVLAWLVEVAAVVGFAPTRLGLALFELRQIAAIKARRAAATAGDLAAIDAALLTAGRTRTGDPDWSLPDGDFTVKLEAAIGGPLALGELPDIDSPEELAAQVTRGDIQQFFATRLPFFPVVDFVEMMARKRAIDSDWAVINGLLQEAGRQRRDDPDFVFTPVDADTFDTNLAAALGEVPAFAEVPLATVASIEDLLTLLTKLEQWFGLTAESIDRLVQTLTKPSNGPDMATEAEWREAYALLARGHAERRYAARLRKLTALRVNQSLQAALGAVTGDAGGPVTVLAERAAGFLEPGEAQRLRQALDQATSGAEPAIGWPQTDALLERAQRRRERLPTPVPRRENWLNLWAYPDATTIHGKDRPWPLFGAPPAGSATQPAATLGWAVASPLLAMSAGTRVIKLLLTFRNDPAAAALRGDRFRSFRLELSTAEGWFAPSFEVVEPAPPVPSADGVGVQLTITLQPTDPALAPPPADDNLADSPAPLARLLLESVQDAKSQRWRQAYDDYRGLLLTQLRIEVAVVAGSGLLPLAVETDAGPVDPAKPFLPFGSRPGVGSALALWHPELLGKPLTEVALTFSWLGLPTPIANLFSPYGVEPPTAVMELIDRGGRTTELTAAAPLFDAVDATRSVTLDLSVPELVTPLALPGPTPTRLADGPRHLRLTLTPRDFQHAAYPTLAAQRAVELAIAMTPGGTLREDSDYYVVPAPYTPRMKLGGLGYAATRSLPLAGHAPGGMAERLYHLHPFGHEELAGSDDPASGVPLLPAYDHEGELYIGIEGALPAQSLSVLVALSPGSGDLALAPPPVRWHVLKPSGWSELSGELTPEDGTAGFVRTGIITFALTEARSSPRLPQNLLWLRASVARHAAALGDALALHPQAGRAKLVEDGVALDHYAQPLPAETIKGPVKTLPGLAKVWQPYPSFGGQPAEDPQGFSTRVAERLRHRHRALTAWDYEHLVLARFPEIYKVKCLTARAADPPGRVQLVVIPDLRGGAADALRPRAAPALLQRVHDYLAPLMPGPAKLEVRNPRFVEVKVRVAVRFVSDRDASFDRQRLEEAINRFLSPWAHENGADIVIGRRIYANSLIAFIDSRDYVDFVASVRLFTSIDDQSAPHAANDYVDAGAEDAILIAAARHEIDLIGDELGTAEKLGGIGYMRIELDFRVAAAP